MAREIVVMDREERKPFWSALKSGYRVLFASTAGEGLAMLSERVDLVFINTKLPDMDSMEVIPVIKKEYPSAAIVIIAAGKTDGSFMNTAPLRNSSHAAGPPRSDEILEKIKLLVSMDFSPPAKQHSLQSAQISVQQQYPDVPPHLVGGVIKVRDHISQNYVESLTLSAACKMASISKTYFCRFFKRITGYSLRTYHHIVRVRIAEELLRDKGLSVKEVAIRTGYDDPNYFSTIFKRITGTSPKQHQSACSIRTS